DCGDEAASARSESEHTRKPNEQWWNDRRSDHVLPSFLPDRDSSVNTGDTTAHTARSVHLGNVFLGTLVAGSFALRLPYRPCSAVCDTPSSVMVRGCPCCLKAFRKNALAAAISRVGLR